MADERTDRQPTRLPSTVHVQIAAVEQVLNALAVQGLRVRSLPSGNWCWDWHGHTGVAAGWGSAIAEAVYWYTGLAADADADWAEEE